MNSSSTRDEERLAANSDSDGCRQASTAAATSSLPFSSCSSSPMDSSLDESSSTSTPPPPPPPHTPRPPSTDMEAYRDFYDRRLQTLEKFRRKVHHDQSDCTPAVQFHQLRADMIELMENDVTLMRQLMALGDRIEELKSLAIFNFSSSATSLISSNGVSPASSMVSLDGVCCEEDDIENNNNLGLVSTTTTAPDLPKMGTNDKENEDDDESGVDEMSEAREDLLTVISSTSPEAIFSPRRVYFSRQNSIFRIPIPPSRGFRSKTVADLQTHHSSSMIGGGVAGIIKRGHSTACETSVSDSCATRGAGWYARMKTGRDLIKSSGSILNSKKREVADHDRGQSPASSSSSSVMTPPYHASQSSCDSGVHHMNNSVDNILDEENLIYV